MRSVHRVSARGKKSGSPEDDDVIVLDMAPNKGPTRADERDTEFVKSSDSFTPRTPPRSRSRDEPPSMEPLLPPSLPSENYHVPASFPQGRFGDAASLQYAANGYPSQFSPSNYYPNYAHYYPSPSGFPYASTNWSSSPALPTPSRSRSNSVNSGSDGSGFSSSNSASPLPIYGDRKEAISDQARIIREAIIASGHYVTSGAVTTRLLQHYGVRDWLDLRVGPATNISAISALVDMEKKINTFINCYIGSCAIVTINDLADALVKEVERDAKDFSQLGMGPLLACPLVIKYFSLQSCTLTSIPTFSAVDLCVCLRAFRHIHTSHSVDLKSFEEYVSKQYNVPSFAYLGVRINSLGLVITNLRIAQSSAEGQERRLVARVCDRIAEEEREKHVADLRRTANQRLLAEMEQLLVSALHASLAVKQRSQTVWISLQASIRERKEQAAALKREGELATKKAKPINMAKGKPTKSTLPSFVIGMQVVTVRDNALLGTIVRETPSKYLLDTGVGLKKKGRDKWKLIPAGKPLPDLVDLTGDEPPRKTSLFDVLSDLASQLDENKVIDLSMAAPAPTAFATDHLPPTPQASRKRPADEIAFDSTLESLLPCESEPDPRPLVMPAYFASVRLEEGHAHEILLLSLLIHKAEGFDLSVWDKQYVPEELVEGIAKLQELHTGKSFTELVSTITALRKSLAHESNSVPAFIVEAVKSHVLIMGLEEQAKHQAEVAKVRAAWTESVQPVMAIAAPAAISVTAPPLVDLFVEETKLRAIVKSEIEDLSVPRGEKSGWTLSRLSQVEENVVSRCSTRTQTYASFVQLNSQKQSFLQYLAEREQFFHVRLAGEQTVSKQEEKIASLMNQAGEQANHLYEIIAQLIDNGLDVASLAEPSVPLQPLKHLTQQLLGCKDGAPSSEVVAACLCQHYGVPQVEKLGYGSIEKIIAKPEKESNPPIIYEESLMPGAKPHAATLSAQEIITAIENAPFVCDLEQYLFWDILFHASHGPFSQFIYNNSSLCSNNLLILCKLQSSGVPSYWKLTKQSKPADFEYACNEGNAQLAIGHFLTLFVSYGNDSMPFQLLAQYLEAAIKTWIFESNSISKPIGFVVSCLRYCPRSLRARFAQKIVYPSLKSSVVDVDAALSQHCGLSSSCESLLDLASELGSEVFLKQREALFESWETAVAPIVSVSEVKQPMFVSTPGIPAVIPPVVSFDPAQAEEAVPPEAEGGGTYQEEVVVQIRRRFGIGVVFDNPEHASLFQHQREMNERAIHHLAQELYSRDTHFVLELIQNADDNMYHSHVSPSIDFSVHPTSIVVFNNEIGFREKDIQSLCDVNKSTKKGASGYIGQKGIGWKSVFRITEHPEIHSRGFHIKFDSRTYVIPTWTTPFPSENGEEGTYTVLPLRSELLASGSARLMEGLHRIPSTVLLFLRQMERISIGGELPRVITRRRLLEAQEGAQVVEVQDRDAKSVWYLVREELPLRGMKRPGLDDKLLESTTVILAFPICELSQKLESQNVFAFLPLRSYGLRFIVQADWVVPSSREEVDCDSSWNQWIRLQLPSLFYKAFTSLHRLPNLPGTSANVKTLLGGFLQNFYRFIPLSGEVQGFFKPVVDGILNLFRSSPCIMSRDGTLVAPDAVVRYSIAQSCGLRTASCFDDGNELPEGSLLDLLSPTLMKTALQLHYLHPSLNDAIGESLSLQLGIKSLSCFHIVQLLRVRTSTIQDPSSPLWVLIVLALICKWLDNLQQQERSALYLQLREIPLLWTGDRFCTLTKETVFFPLDTRGPEYAHMREFKSELSIMDGVIWEQLSEADGTQVRVLLQKLGVKQLSNVHVMKEHIASFYESLHRDENAIAGLSKELLLAKVCFLYQHWQQCPEDVRLRIRAVGGPLVAREDGRWVCAKELYFGRAFANEFAVDQPTLPALSLSKWHIIQPIPSMGTEAKKWMTFFRYFGTSLFAKVVRRPFTFARHAESPWFKSPWPPALLALETSGKPLVYEAEDSESPELEQLLLAVLGLEEQAQKTWLRFIAWSLDTLWDSDYHTQMVASVNPKPFLMVPESSRPSSLCTLLTQMEWVPAILRAPNVKALVRPSVPYLNATEVRSAFEGQVATVDGLELRNPNFIRDLGFRLKPNSKDVLAIIIAWATLPEICLSAALAARLYTTLHTDGLLSSLTIPNPIFLPHLPSSEAYQVPRNSKSQGRFYPVTEVVWSDPADNVCERMGLLRVCATHYSDPTIEFLFRQFGVEAKPRWTQHLKCLVMISKEPFQDARVAAVMSIFRMLAASLTSMSSDTLEQWKAALRYAAVLPSQSGWVTSQTLFIGDDPRKMKLFAEGVADAGEAAASQQASMTLEDILALAESKEQQLKALQAQHEQTKGKVNFISIPPSSPLEAFLLVMGVPRLSESVVESEPTTVELVVGPPLELVVAAALPFAQRFIADYDGQWYESLRAAMIDLQLTTMRCHLAKEIFVECQLGKTLPEGGRSTLCSITKTVQCAFQPASDTPAQLFVQTTAVKRLDLVSVELAKAFPGGDSTAQLRLAGLLERVMGHLTREEDPAYLIEGLVTVDDAPWEMCSALEASRLRKEQEGATQKASELAIQQLREAEFKRQQQEEEQTRLEQLVKNEPLVVLGPDGEPLEPLWKTRERGRVDQLKSNLAKAAERRRLNPIPLEKPAWPTAPTQQIMPNERREHGEKRSRDDGPRNYDEDYDPRDARGNGSDASSGSSSSSNESGGGSSSGSGSNCNCNSSSSSDSSDDGNSSSETGSSSCGGDSESFGDDTSERSPAHVRKKRKEDGDTETIAANAEQTSADWRGSSGSASGRSNENGSNNGSNSVDGPDLIGDSSSSDAQGRDGVVLNITDNESGECEATPVYGVAVRPILTTQWQAPLRDWVPLPPNMHEHDERQEQEGSISTRSLPTSAMDETNRRTGRWGELIVYQYLKALLQEEQSSRYVVWENEFEEQSKPWDVAVMEQRPGPSGEQIAFIHRYIEVKASTASKKAAFRVGPSQVACMLKWRERYEIWRVAPRDATAEVDLQLIVDPVGQVFAGKIELGMTVL